LPFKPPRLHKFPISAEALPDRNTLPSILESLPPGSYTPSPQGTPFHDLTDSQLATPANLRVLHTPGHTADSICLYIPQDRALYTADTVLGQGTAVFEDLALYMASLRKILDFGRSAEGGEGYEYSVLYPGHGPVVSDGPALISTYIKHRLERENQIVEVLKKDPPSIASTDSPASWTTWTLVSNIYAAYPESLWLPAAHGVDLHLKKLEGEGRVRKLGGEGKETSWALAEWKLCRH